LKFRCFKFLFIFILIIIFNHFYLYKFIGTIYLSQKIEIKNNWIKLNTTEIFKKYLTIFQETYDKEVKIHFDKLKHCFSLKVIDDNKNNSSFNIDDKEKLISKFNKKYKKNFNNVKNIFIDDAFNFGNRIIALNNIIYYSEVLGIKNIYLNSAYNWFIKKEIVTDRINISLLNISEINCISSETFCGHNYDFFFPIYLKPHRRTTILKEEIKKNLPKVKTSEDSLYIYIRSGDSFNPKGNQYTPAPYCFYQRILSKFKFNHIYLLSVDDKSPIINKLLSEYPKIIHQLNSMEIDLSLLCNAYNLVNSVSSFSQAAIFFNDNLINLFEYEIYKLGEKIYHLHYDIDKLDKNFTIYRMKPSENYDIKMFIWKNTETQRKLLFEEKCKYDFIKTIYANNII